MIFSDRFFIWLKDWYHRNEKDYCRKKEVIKNNNNFIGKGKYLLSSRYYSLASKDFIKLNINRTRKIETE